MGMKVAIDDFGTGYSSLSYLTNFPSDLLKIDKSFIDKMNQNESSRQYVAMIINIGHTLDLKVISEGVESAARDAGLTGDLSGATELSAVEDLVRPSAQIETNWFDNLCNFLSHLFG